LPGDGIVKGIQVRGSALISIVDDDESIRRALKRFFTSLGFEVAVFASAEEFLSSRLLLDCACLILDLRMSGMSGLELQSVLNTCNRQIPVIFLTAHNDEHARAQALRAGAIDYLRKPFSEDSLLRDVNLAVDQHRLRAH
jgi:FixJ family two-component response regulator